MIVANWKWSWVKPELGLAVVILLGLARITATYPFLSQTWDEPAHIAAGMQLLDQGVFEYEAKHPPLPRVAAALGPYCAGVRSFGQADMFDEGNLILHAENAYFRNLTLARLGILPFFIAASLLVWFWASELYSKTVALAATFLFTMLPPVLAHAGIATTDMAATAALMGCLFSFQLWIERPNLRRSLFFGLTVGCALTTKLSVPIFLAPGLAVITVLHRLGSSPRESQALAKHVWVKRTAQALAVASVFVWASYGFSTRPLRTIEDRPHRIVERITGETGPVRDLAYWVMEKFPFPGLELFDGVQQLFQHAGRGHSAYLLGETGRQGWWSFFPIAIGIKTPLPLLFLACAGAVWTVRSRPPAWRRWAPLVCGLGVLLVCLPSSINIGVRHALPIYPLLAIVGGYAVTCLWQSKRYAVVAQATAAALLIWHGTASIRAHPDYLAYFNELADDRPEEFLVDSDLDWGQGLVALSEELRRRGISTVSLAYFGTADIDRHKLPAPRQLPPGERRRGWIAISVSTMQKEYGFRWLEDHEPVALIRKSIRLYYIPKS
jgi:hypothetical protein